MSDRIVISLGEDGVAVVRLNRPDKLNALDAEMFEALVEAGDGLARERGLRAVVLSGEGRAFSAGLDFAGFQQTADPAARPARNLFDRSAASRPAASGTALLVGYAQLAELRPGSAPAFRVLHPPLPAACERPLTRARAR